MSKAETLVLAARIAGGLGSYIAVIGFGIASNSTRWKMVDEVNARLPEEAQFAHAWWFPGKFHRLLRDYARLFPTGPRIRELRSRSTGMFASMAIGVLVVCPGWCGILGALFFVFLGLAVVWLQFWLVLRSG